MRKVIALAMGAAIAATASYSFAQTSNDRQKNDAGTQSANPDMDKKKGNMGKSGGATGTNTTPTPPGTDTPAGEGSTTSATPKKK